MNDQREYHIDGDFLARETLNDGTPVILRTLRPSDRDLLAQGFERLSEESRYQRFLSIKPSLSSNELSYLTELDPDQHVAIGAGIEHDEDPEEPLGVARFVRYEQQPDVAEVAVAVIDEYQGRGLGRALLAYLVEAARERGIRTFRADTFSTNLPMRALFEEIGPTEVLERAGPVITLDIELTEPSTQAGSEQRPQ